MLRKHLSQLCTLLFSLILCSSLFAESTAENPRIDHLPTPQSVQKPDFTPAPPQVGAKGYLLIDADSGRVLAEKGVDTRMDPASLTKLMTVYIVSAALQAGEVNLEDAVPVSIKAWRTGGSKMFIKEGDNVPLKKLLQGVIVSSGNDASIALAEYLAGSEEAFANLMNQQATILGMHDSHFTNATGFSNTEHYSTPRDMAKLARAVIKHYPEDYQWYKQKSFEYNGIRQENRNRLLWRDASVDGLKTGHTDAAGYCLVASAQRGNMRLIAVVMGAKDEPGRLTAAQQLLNYGFRFYETHKVYAGGSILSQPRVWKGNQKKSPMGIVEDLYVTIPKGQYKHLSAQIEHDTPLEAPLSKGEVYGHVVIKLKNKVHAKFPLIALQDNPKGGIWRRFTDSITLSVKRLVSSKTDDSEAGSAAA
jgi:D-alanyl-D-alanine carboxypeptidase (penicillin-binding protein 5/6)